MLKYLVSGGLPNIINLPLLPTVNGGRISLVARGSEAYTMLDMVEAKLFELCDGDAIPLHKLPPSVMRALVEDGADILNVQTLMPEIVVRYLAINSSPILD